MTRDEEHYQRFFRFISDGCVVDPPLRWRARWFTVEVAS